MLFLRAVRLVWHARAVFSGVSLHETWARMAALRGAPSRLSVTEAYCATQRACRYAGKVGVAKNTCVLRALVLGALLSDHPEVFLHIGFRTSDQAGALATGHAWVSRCGANVSDDGPSSKSDKFTEATCLKLSRS